MRIKKGELISALYGMYFIDLNHGSGRRYVSVWPKEQAKRSDRVHNLVI